MSSTIHEADEHAPFKHILITTPERVVTRINRAREITRTTIGGEQFIICAYCRHWLNRVMPEKCACRASCHAQARAGIAGIETADLVE